MTLTSDRVRYAALTLLSLTLSCSDSTKIADPELWRIEIEPARVMLPEAGDTARLSAVGVFSDQSRIELPVTWRSDAPSVVTIDSIGLARAVATGITTVWAMSGRIAGVAIAAVNPDTLPPSLVTVDADRSRVDVVQRPALVRLTAVFTDDRSGVATALAHFEGPLGASASGIVALELIEEVGRTATFEGFLEVPAVAGAGTWTLSLLRATDGFGNVSKWGNRELSSLGLAVHVEATAIGGGA